MLSVFLVAFGLGLIQLMIYSAHFAISHNLNGAVAGTAVGSAGLFAIGAGVAIPIGRLVFGSQWSIASLILIGGTLVIVAPCVQTLFTPIE